MKERIELTRSAPTGYSKGGDIFMPEPRQTEFSGKTPLQETPVGPAVANAQRLLKEEQRKGLAHKVSPRTQERLQKAWELYYLSQGMEINSLSVGEKRTLQDLINVGIGPSVSGGAESVPTDGITRIELLRIVNEINNEAARLGAERHFSSDYLDRQIARVQELVDQNTFATDPELRQAQDLINTLNQKRDEAYGALRRLQEEREGRVNRFGLYLQPEDITLLSEDPKQWLNNQFDVIYQNVQQGQELNSPVFQNIQTVIGEATRYLQYHNREALVDFQEQFNNRLNLIIMRTTISRRGIEQIQGAATALGVHGLLYGCSLENGEASRLFNRMHELLEDKRLESGFERHHLKPELVNNIQDMLISEEMVFRSQGIGKYVGMDEETAKAEITRAVRASFDVFVSTQRLGVIAARGGYLSDPESYFSDPASGALNHYNLEDLLLKKFNMLNQESEEFLTRIKLEMVEAYLAEQKQKGNIMNLTQDEKLDLGKRLFRDIFAMPDFFSSAWRIKGVKDSIIERFKAAFGEAGITPQGQTAKDFALFMRLTTAEKNEQRRGEANVETRGEVWEKIAKYRPEEMVRLFRERVQNASDRYEPASGELKERLNKLFEKDIFRDYQRQGRIDQNGNPRRGIKNYDEFKEEFGALMHFLRERGFNEIRQLNIGENGFNPQEREIIARWFNADAEKAIELQEMFKEMTKFGRQSINDFLKHHKFTDIYTRTLLIDDAFLDQLESTRFTHTTGYNAEGIPQKITLAKVFTPLSKRYAADQGGDALPRLWSDTGNAINASKSLIAFLQAVKPEDRIKAGIEFAEYTAQYNGQGARTNCIRYTLGIFLDLSKKDYFWDIVGFEKLPFERSMSEIERIFGPEAKPMGREELRHEMHKIRTLLKANLDKESEEEKALPMSERIKLRKEREEKAKKTFGDLEHLLETAWTDILKKRTLSVLLYLILASLGTVAQTVGKSVEMKAA